MNSEQLEIFTHRQNEWTIVLEDIAALDISKKWISVFTDLCLRRGFRHLSSAHLSQMQNIAAVNSPAVIYLALQDKRAGLHTLEDISIKIIDEAVRLKAVQMIMDKGIKPSKNELDLIIHAAKNTRSLFDVE